jgi:hypothetical protein
MKEIHLMCKNQELNEKEKQKAEIHTFNEVPKWKAKDKQQNIIGIVAEIVAFCFDLKFLDDARLLFLMISHTLPLIVIHVNKTNA